MTKDQELLKLVVELDHALESEDTTLIEKVAYRIPREVLFGDELLETARVYRQARVIKFLATLIGCNTAKREWIELLLEAYQSIGALAMTERILARALQSPLRMAVMSIVAGN